MVIEQLDLRVEVSNVAQTTRADGKRVTFHDRPRSYHPVRGSIRVTYSQHG